MLYAPLLPIVAPLLLGLWLGAALWPLPVWTWAISLSMLLAVAVVPARPRLTLVVAGALSLGMARAGTLPGPSPEQGEGSWWVRLDADGAEPHLRAVSVLVGAAGPGGAARLRPALLRLPAWPPDSVGMRGELWAARGVLLPAEPGRSDARPSLVVTRPHRMVRVGDAPATSRVLHPWDRLVLYLRVRIRTAMDRHSDPALAALHRALVLGERGGLRAEDNAAFVQTGTVHLLSISGVHITAGALPMWWIARTLLRRLAGEGGASGWPDRVAPAVALVGAGLYVAVAGAPLPAFRSLGMLFFAALAALVSRRPDPWNLLLGSALCILWVDPDASRNLGFHLSYLSVSGLLVASRWAEDIPGSWPRPIRTAAALLLASVAATIACAPVLAWHWQEVPLAGLWANSLAIPLLGEFAVPLLLLAAGLGVIHPDLAAGPIVVAQWSEWLGMRWVHLCADPRWSPAVPWSASAGGVVFALLAWFLHAAQPKTENRR